MSASQTRLRVMARSSASSPQEAAVAIHQADPSPQAHESISQRSSPRALPSSRATHQAPSMCSASQSPRATFPPDLPPAISATRQSFPEPPASTCRYTPLSHNAPPHPYSASSQKKSLPAPTAERTDPTTSAAPQDRFPPSAHPETLPAVNE